MKKIVKGKFRPLAREYQSLIAEIKYFNSIGHLKYNILENALKSRLKFFIFSNFITVGVL